MAGSVNKVILVGHLGKDPEIRYTPAGMATAKFSLATSETRKKDGQKEEKTEWHNIVVFDKLAEICGEYLTKGKLVYISGKIQTRSWDDKKDGTKKYMTEILANEMQMLGSKDSGGPGKSASSKPSQTPDSSAGESAPPDYDDVPF